MSEWKEIEDKNVQMTWECPVCKESCRLNPNWYEENGTPMCSEGEDMVYINTEIKQ